MPLNIDPERREIQTLRDASSWSGKQVLEIGCGGGRLARRLARMGSRLTGIDPQEVLVQDAQAAPPRRYTQRLRYCAGKGEQLPFSAQAFDTAVFGWSL